MSAGVHRFRLFIAIGMVGAIQSVVFGESQGPIEGTVAGVKKQLYKWPVQEPIKLEDPLKFITGKQGIWKIQF